jgi:hypothetical protein
MLALQPDSASVHPLTFSRTDDPSTLLLCTVEKKRQETVPQTGHRSHNFVLVPSYGILWPLPQFSLGHVENVVKRIEMAHRLRSEVKVVLMRTIPSST